MGTLYYGDNLDILRRYLDDESVDLVYLDPPFNSARDLPRPQRYDGYLAMMAPRLVELRRVLKKTGSLYLDSERLYDDIPFAVRRR